ncbi:MAG: hypothetical protein WAV23_00135 [Minisyncoccia bacterium]
MNMNDIEKKPPMNEKEMLSFLLQNGYIKEIEEYNDSKKVLQIDNKDFPEEILWNIEILKKLVSLPIMSDSIEELVTNEARGKIRNDLYKKNPALSNFYKDHNKLQSSSLLTMLFMVDEYISKHVNLSEKIKNELKRLKFEFSGLDEETISARRYKNELDNARKIDLARRITSLAEDAILESVKK